MAEKTRYSDEELQEFKELILEKLDKARKDYDLLKGVISGSDGNDIADTPYFHAFFHFFGQQVEQRIGYRVIAEIEVFQMNVVFGVADGAE